MGRKDSWRIVRFLGLLLVTSAYCGCVAPHPEGMNVLMITLDTTRADHVSPLGAEPRITPNLQAWSARSCLFTNAVSETNITNPSHLSIMTGLRAIEHGVMSNRVSVPESVDTLAEAMRRAGYRTAGFPAAPHLGRAMGWRGFDVLPEIRSLLGAEAITARAVAWLRENGDAPFFLWVHYFDPHVPYDPPADIAAKFYRGDRESGDGPRIADLDFFKRRRRSGPVRAWLAATRDPEYPRAMYAGEVHYMDREIGHLLDQIEYLGLGNDTVVVVVADHAESLGEHGIFYAHSGLYEQQLRIPFIIGLPGLEPSRSDAFVSTLDVAPTISELTGVRLRHEPSGLSLVPLLLGEASSELAARSTFVHQNARNRAVAVRQDHWKLIWPVDQKWILWQPPQLYDLKADPEELVNLAAEQPGRVRAMRRLIQPWIDLGPVRSGSVSNLDEAVREELRALGYLGD